MIPILYDKTETAYISNGLCRLRDCISCKVTEERNGVYECDFTYPVNGANFEQIVPGRTIGVTHDETGDVQPFDIVAYTKPINGIVTFHCVHYSYRLKEVVFNTSVAVNSLADAFTLLGTAAPAFSFSADFTATGYASAFGMIPRTVRQVLGGMDGSVLDTYGGEFRWNKNSVELLKARGQMRDFTVRYGVNLVDFNDEADFEATFSSCVPYWVNGDEIVLGDMVNSGMDTYNGRNIIVPLDLTDKFEDKPTKAQLESAAASYMNANKTTLPKQTIKVDFIRLQDSPEYEQYKGLLNCGLCDSINVVFPAYNMSGIFKIVRTVWDVLEGRYTEMELGDLSTTLSEALGITDSSPKSASVWSSIANKQGVVTVGDVLIQYGTVSVTTGSTASSGVYNGHTSVLFDADYPFAKTPVVMLTWEVNWTYQDSLSAVNASTTGFDAYGRTKSSEKTVSIKWLAIGQKG